MNRFFKPEEFATCADHPEISEKNCDYANAKLEREGKIVFAPTTGSAWLSHGQYNQVKYKALLINIEPIEKCKHSSDKIRHSQKHLSTPVYTCECGAKVTPKEFEEVK